MVLKYSLSVFLVSLIASLGMFTIEGMVNLPFVDKWWGLNNNTCLDRDRKSLFTVTHAYTLILGQFAVVPLYLIFLCLNFLQAWWAFPIFVVISGLYITIVEFIGGLILNKVFKLGLWDYRTKTGKVFLGQTDLVHYIIWNLVSILVIFLFHVCLYLIK